MAKIGQTMQYNITVKNTGNYKIENVTVSDPMLELRADHQPGQGRVKDLPDRLVP